MREKACAPAIRFKEFTSDWEPRRLGEALQTLPFKSFIKAPEPDGEYEIIQQGNDPVLGRANGTPCHDYEDTVIFGDHTLSLYKPCKPFFVATDGVRIVKGRERLDGFYLSALLEKYRPQSEGYKRYYSILAGRGCYMTENQEEQARIGQYLRRLAALITLYQRKYSQLCGVKKSMLERMFPKEGAAVPEVRFSGFTGPWERRSLGQISEKITVKNTEMEFTETFTNSAELGIVSQRDFFEHDIAKQDRIDRYYIVHPEDFVYNPRISASAPVGPINRNKLGRCGVMSPLYSVFRPQGMDNSFLEQFFKSSHWHSFMRFNGDSGARSDRFSIKDTVFFEMPIPCPALPEQERIGSFLSGLDRLISLHQRKLERLQGIKQACLEKMFV